MSSCDLGAAFLSRHSVSTAVNACRALRVESLFFLGFETHIPKVPWGREVGEGDYRSGPDGPAHRHVLAKRAGAAVEVRLQNGKAVAMTKTELFAEFGRSYRERQPTEMSLEGYLELCREAPKTYASAAERILHAIGEPTLLDTSKDQRLGRIFMNRTIRVYPAFDEFFGMEETIERIVSFFRHAAQGLEERKQILYLLGPVGGGKSSLAERLKALMEVSPIYVLKAGNEISPVFESPLGLFNPAETGELLEKRYGIPRRRLGGPMSPWCLKRLDEFGGDLTKFTVVKVSPSRLRQVAIAKTEPGDENNQDISSLVGKVDIRKLEAHAQADPDFSHGAARRR